MRLDLARDPDVVNIAAALQITEQHAVGLLHSFWAWMSEQTTDGDAPTVTKVWMDRHVGVTGFCDALQNLTPTPWLSESGTGIRLEHFDEHNSDSAKERAKARLRTQKWRSKESNDGDGVTVTQTSPQNRTEPDRTRPDPTEPNPKKTDPVPVAGLPDSANEEFTGSDRKKEDAFRQLFAAKILAAIGCDDTKTQKVPLFAVANRIMFRADRDVVANEMLLVAKDKRDKGLRNPMAAWQKEIDKQWPK